MNQDEAIKDFLGDRPQSGQLKDWRVTLEERLAGLQQELTERGDGAGRLGLKIEQLKRQIAALREEEAVTEFVEDSVRVTLAMGQDSEATNEYED
jgi:hypothetical protein